MVFAAFFTATVVLLAMYAYGAWRDFVRFGDLLGAAQLLMIVLGYSIICRVPAPPGDFGNMIWLVLVDFAGLLASGYWYVTRTQKWSAMLFGTYLAQLAVHLWFWTFSRQDFHAQYVYTLLLNSLAVLQIPIVGWPGARYVAGKVGAFLLHRGDGRVGFGHGALP